MSTSATDSLLERHQLPYTVKRDKKGRWVPGHTGNPAGATNIAVRSTRFYMRLLREAVTPEKFLAVCNRVIDDAINGNQHAYKLLFQYLIGPALQALVLAQEQTVITGDRQETITRILTTLAPLAREVQESSGGDITA